MVDATVSTTSQSSAAATIAAQHAQTPLTNGLNKNTFISLLSQTDFAQEITANALLNIDVPANTSSNVHDFGMASSTEDLLSLNTPSLSLLNEVGTDPSNPNITGNLTPQQLQEIGILQQDVLKLEEAEAFTLGIPLTSDATTVDLSLKAQNLAATGAVPTASDTSQANATASTSTTAQANATTGNSQFTEAQLQKLGLILQPFANLPLNSNLLIQIQAQLTASQFNSQQLSLSTIFLALSYMAGYQAGLRFKTTTSYHPDEVAPVEETESIHSTDTITGSAVF